ncbi:MAG: O-antigen ligase family protein [Candidatus Methylopumilus sp.]
MLLIPLGFIAFHFLAVGNLVLIKEIRHIVLATCLALGVWMLAKRNPDVIRKSAYGFILGLILVYVVIQAIALWWFDMPYGTTKNPHYLALYSAIALIVSVYYFFRASQALKLLIAISMLLLGAFILCTSSRPAWIGLIFASFLTVLFLKRRTRILSAFALAIVLIGLSFTNVANFTNRFDELLTNLSTEERVVIWHDAWKMQKESSVSQWITGHGLDSFEEDFKPYSQYHLINVDFNSPHNFVLELLYISGLAGISLFGWMLFLLYKNLRSGMRNQIQYKNIYLTLMAIITSNFIFVSITLPFFTSYNLNVIAVVAGTMLFLKEMSAKQTQ